MLFLKEMYVIMEYVIRFFFLRMLVIFLKKNTHYDVFNTEKTQQGDYYTTDQCQKTAGCLAQ